MAISILTSFPTSNRDLQQPIAPIHRVGTVVTAAALAVVAGGLADDQAHFDGVAQADQAVAQLGLAVEGLDLVLQVAQLADGAREPVAGARPAPRSAT